MSADEEPKYLAIRNWEKYQKNHAGKVTAEGEPVRYIKDWTDKDSDSDYSKLTAFERYVLDALRRLRGRFGHNPHNNPTWCARATCMLHRDRTHMAHAIHRLVTEGFLVLTNQLVGFQEVPLIEKSRVEKSRVDAIPHPPSGNGDGFDAFWELYPRKIGKLGAKKSWMRAIKICPAERITAALKVAIPSWNDPQYIPHATTWLNQGRWEDQPITQKTQRDKNHEVIENWLANFKEDDSEMA